MSILEKIRATTVVRAASTARGAQDRELTNQSPANRALPPRMKLSTSKKNHRQEQVEDHDPYERQDDCECHDHARAAELLHAGKSLLLLLGGHLGVVLDLRSGRGLLLVRLLDDQVLKDKDAPQLDEDHDQQRNQPGIPPGRKLEGPRRNGQCAHEAGEG